MKVALNAKALLSPRTGIGQYVHALASALLQSGELDLEFFYGLGWSRTLRAKPVQHIGTAKSAFKTIVPQSYAVERLVTQLCFSARARRARFDLYHEPNYLAHEFAGPVVLTVHDLSFVRYPELHPPARIERLQAHFPASLARASLVLTDAEAVRKEVLDRYGLPPDRVRAVPLAATAAYRERTAAEVTRTLARHALAHRGFVLGVGTLEPRKNIPFVLEAYDRLPTALRRRFPLALAGMSGWLNSALERRLRPLAERGEVRMLGYVSDAELQDLYAAAALFVYPSLYEGFGLPPLEAMQSGVPVIVSNVSSLPEVVGDAGLQVDPADVDALVRSMHRLLEDRTEWERRRQAGLARARRFSWQKCAAETLAAYRDAVKAPRQA